MKKSIIILVLFYATVASGTMAVNEYYSEGRHDRYPYKFIIAGHIYGDPYGHGSYPASSIIANLDVINNMGAKFFISAGDMLMKVDDINIQHLRDSFLTKIDIPFYNAIGNMDAQNRELYEYHFGKTYFAFKFQTELFIFLDTELDDGSLLGEQLSFFKKTVLESAENIDIKNILVITHRLWWNKAYDDFEALYKHTHVLYPENNFKTDVLPFVQKYSHKYQFFFIAGDIGGEQWLPLFYHKDDSNITYIATGVGDSYSDYIIVAEVTKERDVTFNPLSLYDFKEADIKNYDVAYWTKYYNESGMYNSFNSLIFTLYRKSINVISSRRFWYGFFCALILWLIFFIAIKTSKKMSK